MANFRSAAALFAAFSMLAGSSAYAAGQSNADVASESVDIAFDYQRGGIASSQYAIWVEDAAGKPSFGVCRPIAGLENRALGVAITSQGRTSTETCRRRCKRSCSPFQSRSWKRFQRGRPTCTAPKPCR